jgi:hypothetical protein
MKRNQMWGTCLTMVSLVMMFTWTVLADQQPVQQQVEVQDTLTLLMDSMEHTGADVQAIYLHEGSRYQTYASAEDIQEFADKLGVHLGLMNDANPSTTTSYYERQRGGKE